MATVATTPAAEALPKRPNAVWQFIKSEPLGIFGFLIILLYVVCALGAHWIAHYHPEEIDFAAMLAAPGEAHWFGTDQYGRDVFSRIVYGARISLLVAFLSAFVAVSLGTFFGIVAGYFGGWVDAAISRVMDLLLAFPQLLFIIALVSVVPAKLWGFEGSGLRIAVLVLVIGFFGWPYIGRIVRGQTLSLREREYVEAARSLGAGRLYILFRELLPNLVAPITVYATLMIPTNVLTEAALSFLGVGVKPPTPSWGETLSTAVRTYEDDPLFMIFPGMAIFITVLAFNLFGDGVRDALDPKGSR